MAIRRWSKFPLAAAIFDFGADRFADNTRREIVNVLTKMGFEVEASYHEVVQSASTRLTLHDEVLRPGQDSDFKLARRPLLVSTPLCDLIWWTISGNGDHSFDQDGTMPFSDPEDPSGYAAVNSHFLGGLINHAYNYTALSRIQRSTS